MKHSLPFLVIALALTASMSIVAAGRPQDSAQPVPGTAQDDPGTPRVARLLEFTGDVSFQREGDTDWVQAARNLPLLPGDQLYTGGAAHASVQLSRGSFLSLSENTQLTIADLSADAAQFEVTEGAVTIEIGDFREAFSRVEIDTPTAAEILERNGVYRVSIQSEGDAILTTRQGLATATGEDGTIRVREGLELHVGTRGSGIMDIEAIGTLQDENQAVPIPDPAPDSPVDGSLAMYSDQGASLGQRSPDYVSTYESTYASIYGADELARYGNWTNIPSYGNAWVPNEGYGWAPYRIGHWLWIPAAGWTWISDEPWGWAPYYYGRWAFVDGIGWAWFPGFGPYTYDPVYYFWQPALVEYFTAVGPNGYSYVAWAPLLPGQPWHRHHHHRHHDREAIASTNLNALAASPRGRGVSMLPVSAFTGAAAGKPESAHALVAGSAARRKSRGLTVTEGLPDIDPAPGARNVAHSGGGRPGAVPRVNAAAIGVLTLNMPARASTGLVQRDRALVTPAPPANFSRRTEAGDSGSGDGAVTSGSVGGPAGTERTRVQNNVRVAGQGGRAEERRGEERRGEERRGEERRGEERGAHIAGPAGSSGSSGTKSSYVPPATLAPSRPGGNAGPPAQHTQPPSAAPRATGGEPARNKR